MFDFTRVREVDGKRSAGFEELCVQLADGLCSSSVTEVIRVDGAGGDGGVEAIVKTDDNRVIGIQCKYFVVQLGQVQWRQLDKSVRQAVKKHPELTDYFVCVPQDRTPAGNSKWGALTQSWKKVRPKLRVTWFGQSELGGLLSRSKWNYLAAYWLGMPAFSAQWLQEQCALGVRQLHRRYTPRLHNKTRAERELSQFLGLESAREEYQNASRGLAVEVRKLLPTLKGKKWPEDAAALDQKCADASSAAALVLQEMCNGSLVDQKEGFGQALDALAQSFRAASNEALSVERGERKTEAPDKYQYVFHTISRELPKAAYLAEKLLAQFNRHIKARKAPIWLLTGEAGTGKSHLLATMVQRTLSESGGALLPLASSLSTAALSHLKLSPFLVGRTPCPTCCRAFRRMRSMSTGPQYL